jgi:NAD+ synthase (glutamine-hydrolysing)
MKATFSRGGPGLKLDAGGVPFGDYQFKFDFGDVAVEVCEDAWSPDGPMRRRCYSGSEIVVNVSTSPYRMGVDSTRREMLATRAADNQALLLYANAVGGQDGLIYDGGGSSSRTAACVRGAALRRGLVVDGRRSRSHRAAAHGKHHVAIGLRSVPLERQIVPIIRVDGPTADFSSLAYPAPMAATSSSRRSSGARSIRATARSTICSKRSRSA